MFRELCDSVDRELFACTDDGHSYFKTNYANEISGRLHISSATDLVSWMSGDLNHLGSYSYASAIVITWERICEGKTCEVNLRR